MPVLPVRNVAACEVMVVHRLMRRMCRDRHTPHLAITHIVRFNNLKERAVWFGGKVAHFWHCFTLVVLVWFGFPGTLVWSCVAGTNDLRLTPRALHRVQLHEQCMAAAHTACASASVPASEVRGVAGTMRWPVGGVSGNV